MLDLTALEWMPNNLRPHAVRICSGSYAESVIATCHILRCKAPVISSAVISGTGCRLVATGGSALDADELESEELDAASEPGSSSNGASASIGISVRSVNLKYSQSKAGRLFLNNWVWKDGSSIGACPPLASGVVGLNPVRMEFTMDDCSFKAP